MIEHRVNGRPVRRCRVERVGDPYASFAVDGKVGGLIVILALELIGRLYCGAIGLELDNASAAFLRPVRRPVRPDRDAVRTAGVTAKVRDLVRARVEFVDALLLHCAEEHVFAIPCKTARRTFIRPRDQIEFPVHIHFLSRSDIGLFSAARRISTPLRPEA
jgi:hypothetical protein